MGHPLSMDLRSRLLAAIDEGLSCRAAAARFGVAPSTAIRWHGRRRDTGTFAAKPQGGDLRSLSIGVQKCPPIGAQGPPRGMTCPPMIPQS